MDEQQDPTNHDGCKEATRKDGPDLLREQTDLEARKGSKSPRILGTEENTGLEGTRGYEGTSAHEETPVAAGTQGREEPAEGDSSQVGKGLNSPNDFQAQGSSSDGTDQGHTENQGDSTEQEASNLRADFQGRRTLRPRKAAKRQISSAERRQSRNVVQPGRNVNDKMDSDVRKSTAAKGRRRSRSRDRSAARTPKSCAYKLEYPGI